MPVGSGKQLGIGVSVYVEITGGVDPFGEHAKIEVLDDGRAVVYTGTSPHGQGHVTAWAMLAHEQTGIPMDEIDLVWGDTDLVPTGYGTMGSRSLQQGGGGMAGVGELDTPPASSPRLLENPNEADVVLDKDTVMCGTPAVAKSWAELSVAARRTAISRTARGATYQASGPTFPFGSHVAVEVDTETGQVGTFAMWHATTPARC